MKNRIHLFLIVFMTFLIFSFSCYGQDVSFQNYGTFSEHDGDLLFTPSGSNSPMVINLPREGEGDSIYPIVDVVGGGILGDLFVSLANAEEAENAQEVCNSYYTYPDDFVQDGQYHVIWWHEFYDDLVITIDYIKSASVVEENGQRYLYYYYYDSRQMNTAECDWYVTHYPTGSRKLPFGVSWVRMQGEKGGFYTDYPYWLNSSGAIVETGEMGQYFGDVNVKKQELFDEKNVTGETGDIPIVIPEITPIKKDSNVQYYTMEDGTTYKFIFNLYTTNMTDVDAGGNIDWVKFWASADLRVDRVVKAIQSISDNGNNIGDDKLIPDNFDWEGDSDNDNWFTKLMKAIGNFVKWLVVPKETEDEDGNKSNVVTDNFNSLTDTFCDKLGYTNYTNSLNGLKEVGESVKTNSGISFSDNSESETLNIMGVEIQNKEIIEFSIWDKHLEAIRNIIRGFYYCMMVIFNVKMLQNMIRATSPISTGQGNGIESANIKQ